MGAQRLAAFRPAADHRRLERLGGDDLPGASAQPGDIGRRADADQLVDPGAADHLRVVCRRGLFLPAAPPHLAGADLAGCRPGHCPLDAARPAGLVSLATHRPAALRHRLAGAGAARTAAGHRNEAALLSPCAALAGFEPPAALGGPPAGGIRPAVEQRQCRHRQPDLWHGAGLLPAGGMGRRAAGGFWKSVALPVPGGLFDPHLERLSAGAFRPAGAPDGIRRPAAGAEPAAAGSRALDREAAAAQRGHRRLAFCFTAVLRRLHLPANRHGAGGARTPGADRRPALRYPGVRLLSLALPPTAVGLPGKRHLARRHAALAGGVRSACRPPGLGADRLRSAVYGRGIPAARQNRNPDK